MRCRIGRAEPATEAALLEGGRNGETPGVACIGQDRLNSLATSRVFDGMDIVFPAMLSLVFQAAPAEPPMEAVEKAPARMVVIGCPPLGRHFLFRVPRSDSGLWLDPKGKPSPRLTALSLLVLAGEGEWARNGRYRREIRSVCRTLLAGAPGRVAAQVRRTDSEVYDDVLITLALYMQARKTQYKFIYEGLDPLMRRVMDDKRMRRVFPRQGAGSPKLDRARFAYLLLWKQIQVFRVAHPDVAARDQRLADLDVEPIRLWLDHGLKDQEAGAERLLLLFLGHLLLVPPKEPPLSAGITGCSGSARRTRSN